MSSQAAKFWSLLLLHNSRAADSALEYFLKEAPSHCPWKHYSNSKGNAMVQKATRIIVLIFFLCGIAALQARADTEVGGRLRQDTVWSASGSPYILKENLIVSEGVTLTIEAGVEVLFYQTDGQSGFRYSITVEGRLIARGEATAPILFSSTRAQADPGDWDAVTFTQTATGAVYDTDGSYVSGSILEHVAMQYGGGGGSAMINCTGSAPYLNSVALRDSTGGGIAYTDVPAARINASVFERNSGSLGGAVSYSTALFSVSAPTLRISESSFTGNISKKDGGAVCFYSPLFSPSTVLITGCIFQHNEAKQYGGAVYSSAAALFSSFEITGTSFLYNNSGDDGSALFQKGPRLVMKDTLAAGNQGPVAIRLTNAVISSSSIVSNFPPAGGEDASGDGIAVDTGLSITGSNIFGHARYNIRNESSARINAENNYWGTVAEPEISAGFYDFFTDPEKGEIDYYPYLEDIAPDAPIIPDIVTTTSSISPTTTTIPDNGTTTTTAPDNGTATTTVPDNGTTTITTTVIPETEIEVDFIAGSRTGLVPLKVDFTNLTHSTLPVSMYEWDFGDGGTSTDQNPTHVYFKRGIFRVTLTAYATDGTTAQKTRAGYIRAGFFQMFHYIHAGL